MQTFQIIVGLIIIITTFLDFFHTTLSGRGFGFISRAVNRMLNRIIIQNQTRSIFQFSGLVHVLTTTFVWLFLLFCGTFLVYTASSFMVVNGTTGVPADYSERFYFTGFVLSTLGVGDYIPGNNVSQVITGTLSFSGFILITTGLTYLLSVINAVLSKKELSFLLSSMGSDIEELYFFFRKQDDLSNLISDASDLRQQILQNSSSYLAFPMVNYFLTSKRQSALIVQLAILYEVLMVLKLDWREETFQYAKICTIINAIEKYLELGLEVPEAAKHNEDKLRTLRSYWKKHGYDLENNPKNDHQFSSSLKYAGWSWEDVYKVKEQLRPDDRDKKSGR